MKIYRFRILLDNANNVFRDIEISAEAPCAELHEAIIEAFEFSGDEVASFFLSNEEWDKGEEIALMDFSEPGVGHVRNMIDTRLKDVVYDKGDKMLYLYDFLRMWIWYVELSDIIEAEKGADYPRVVLSVGDAPEEGSKGMVDSFESEGDDDPFGDFDDGFDESDFDNFDGEQFH
ncbi:MAG: hypothetical protein ABR572_02860 [Cryomorphaceae bacterium]|nr:plasmid pRiA4b ORF-3 family protein [Flavobacteriales bacterium]